MATILEALNAQLEDASASTISEAIDALTGRTGHNTIATALNGAQISGGNVAAYIVTFNGNGATAGSVSPVACADGSTVKLPAGTAYTAPSSKVFGGWATAAAATKADYEAGDDFAATEATTLYAFWANAS